jgi:hypothetical protein
MELTRSYERVFDSQLRQRYDFLETRNAAALLQAIAPDEFAEVVSVLSRFELLASDLTQPGGNKSQLASRLDLEFREMGWREGRHDLRITSTVRLMPYSAASERTPIETLHEGVSVGYKVDNLKGRVAVDVEWNAKDGNLDRDLGAYRTLYDEALLDGAVIITRSTDDLRALASQLGADAKKLGTTTTTNIVKLRDRLARGAAGGCPVLAVAITARCFEA